MIWYLLGCGGVTRSPIILSTVFLCCSFLCSKLERSFWQVRSRSRMELGTRRRVDNSGDAAARFLSVFTCVYTNIRRIPDHPSSVILSSSGYVPNDFTTMDVRFQSRVLSNEALDSFASDSTDSNYLPLRYLYHLGLLSTALARHLEVRRSLRSLYWTFLTLFHPRQCSQVYQSNSHVK